MTTSNATATTTYEIQCTHHTFIFRNDALKKKYPGGLVEFRNRYVSGSNDFITVNCAPNNAVDTIRELEAIGLEQGKDYVAINTYECEMMQLICSADIELPFWFETGADWLKYKHRDGKVLVWYDRWFY